MCRLVFCLLALHLAFIDGRSLYYEYSPDDERPFRSDYTYYSLANGWMKLHPMPVTWDEARLICNLEGSVLASPLNDRIMLTMRKVTTHIAPTIFTGISATDARGVFFSVDGVPIERMWTKWAPGEPNNVNGQEQCIAFNSNGTLSDVSCSQPRPYICYKKKTPNNPLINQCDTTDPGYVFNKRTGHCYKFHRYGQTWSRAVLTCAAEGGHLAIINSMTEADALKVMGEKIPLTQIMAVDKYYMLLGARDWSDHGKWMTIHGQSLQEAGYEHWYSNQPQNYGENCVALYRGEEYSGLHDIYCNVTAPFVCEKKPRSCKKTASLLYKEDESNQNATPADFVENESSQNLTPTEIDASESVQNIKLNKPDDDELYQNMILTEDESNIIMEPAENESIQNLTPTEHGENDLKYQNMMSVQDYDSNINMKPAEYVDNASNQNVTPTEHDEHDLKYQNKMSVHDYDSNENMIPAEYVDNELNQNLTPTEHDEHDLKYQDTMSVHDYDSNKNMIPAEYVDNESNQNLTPTENDDNAFTQDKKFDEHDDELYRKNVSFIENEIGLNEHTTPPPQLDLDLIYQYWKNIDLTTSGKLEDDI